MADRRHLRDAGFTLPEMLIVIVLIALLSVAISGVFGVFVRTMPETEARVDDARSLLGLSTWLPADVNSTPATPVGEVDAPGAAFDTRPTASTGCAGSDDGHNLLRLAWSESYGAPTDYTASYRFVERGSGWHIVRVTCTDGGTASVINTTAALPPPEDDPIAVTYKVVDGEVVGVVFEVVTIDEGKLRVDAVSHNPDATLPPLPTVAVDPTTTTTSTTTTTTTTVPAVSSGVCGLLASISTILQLPTPAETLLRDLGADGLAGALTTPARVNAGLLVGIYLNVLGLDLDLTLCSTVQLAYNTGTTEVIVPMHAEGYCAASINVLLAEICVSLGVNLYVDLPADATQLWLSGSHEAHLVDGSGNPIPGTSTEFVVDVDPATEPPPCTATFAAVAPSSVYNTNNANSNNTNKVIAGALAEPVTVTVAKGANCANLGLEYVHDPGDGSVPPSVGWLPFGASSQVVIARSNQESWVDGDRVLRLRDGQHGGVVAETTLELR